MQHLARSGMGTKQMGATEDDEVLAPSRGLPGGVMIFGSCMTSSPNEGAAKPLGW